MNSKVLVWSYLIILSFATILNLYMPKNEAVAKDSIVIPGEAIRLRILANSDSGPDQEIKRKVRDAVNAQITLWVQDLTSLEKAKEVIQSKVPEIQKIAEKVVAEQKSTQGVNVEFGKVQFPTKLYGQFLYPAGEYQAILITLGEGVGANWWCVLYPPLCFLDFSNGVAVSDGFEDSQKVKAAMMEPEAEKVDEVDVEEEVVKKKMVDRDEPKEIVVEEKEEPVVTGEIAESDEILEEEEAPVYTAEDEQPVKVKFFVVELWESIFH
jgi:stage II sporulation protein R